MKYFILLDANNNSSGENIQNLLEKIDAEQKQQTKGQGLIDAVNHYAHNNKALQNLQDKMLVSTQVPKGVMNQSKVYPLTKKKTDKFAFLNDAENKGNNLYDLRLKAASYMNVIIIIINKNFN